MFEPSYYFVEVHAVLNERQNHFLGIGVNLSLIVAAKLIATSQKEQIHHEQRGTFVAVNKTVI